MQDCSESVSSPEPCVYLLAGDSGLRSQLLGAIQYAGFLCSEFESVEGLLAAVDVRSAGCVVVVCKASREGQADWQRQLSKSGPPLVVLTDQCDVPSAVDRMHRGAVSVLLTPCQPDALVSAVRRAMRLSRTRGELRSRFEAICSAVETLSSREREVLQAMVDGKLNKAIARSLDVSVRTVEGDRAKIVDKLGAQNACEVIGMYAQYCLFDELQRAAGEDGCFDAGAI